MAVALDEIELTPARRALLERLAASSTERYDEAERLEHGIPLGVAVVARPIEVRGGEIGAARRLSGLGLATFDPATFLAAVLPRGRAWLEANPRRGRPRVRDGLVVRLDVRVDRATNDRLEAKAGAEQTNRGALVRRFIAEGLEADRWVCRACNAHGAGEFADHECPPSFPA